MKEKAALAAAAMFAKPMRVIYAKEKMMQKMTCRWKGMYGWLVPAVLLTVVLTGCGPMYETRYNLTPPPGQMGQVCANQCDQIRLQCMQGEDMRIQNCETQNRLARLEYEQCKQRGYSDCYEDTSWCSSDYEPCEEQFRLCYQNCGGKVESYQVCVFNCK